jgi:MFS family permease
VLLAVVLVLVVFGLYNPAPDGKQVLPENGWILLCGAAVATVAFFVWEKIAKTKLIDPVGVHFRPFLCALGASFAAGAALMVTLVNVELFGQAVLSLDQNEAAFLLMRFLVALPVGALLGGWIATRIGDRVVAFAGLVIAAFAYWLISQWPVDLLAARHDFGLFTLPTMDVDLALAGFGLGIVIGPLTSAALRVVPAPQHGIASSLVVVARMTGMLVGVAALSAWGLYRFNQHLQSLPKSAPGGNLLDTIRIQADNYRVAYAMQYGEIFAITAVVCVVGALLGLFISGKNETAEIPADDPDANPDEAEAVRATR